ncbi:hypothetical protein FOVSG1_002498 [Fusarium oxysporum f. sp. vasinfectum]
MAVLQDCTPFQRYESQVYVAHNPENSRLSVVGSEPVLKYIHQLAPTRRLTTRQNAKNVGFSGLDREDSLRVGVKQCPICHFFGTDSCIASYLDHVEKAYKPGNPCWTLKVLLSI